MMHNIRIKIFLLCILLGGSKVTVLAQTHCDMLMERYHDKVAELKKYRNQHINDANYPDPPPSDPDCDYPYDEEAMERWKEKVFEPEMSMLRDFISLAKDIESQRCPQRNTIALTDGQPMLDMIDHKCNYYLKKFGKNPYHYMQVIRTAISGYKTMELLGGGRASVLADLGDYLAYHLDLAKERVGIYHEYKASGTNIVRLMKQAALLGVDVNLEHYLREVVYKPLQFDLDITITAVKYKDGSTDEPRMEFKVKTHTHLALDTVLLYGQAVMKWLPEKANFTYEQRNYHSENGERLVYTSPNQYSIDWKVMIDPHCPPRGEDGNPPPPDSPEVRIEMKRLAPLYDNYTSYPADASEPCKPQTVSVPMPDGKVMKTVGYADCHSECINCPGALHTLCGGGLTPLLKNKNQEDIDKMQEEFANMTPRMMDSLMKNIDKLVEQAQGIGSYKIEAMLPSGKPVPIDTVYETPQAQIQEISAYVRMEVKLTHAPRNPQYMRRR